MRKISLILFTVILNFMLFSCNPESIVDEVTSPQACCDGEGTIPPPPPPPPPGGDDETGD